MHSVLQRGCRFGSFEEARCSFLNRCLSSIGTVGGGGGGSSQRQALHGVCNCIFGGVAVATSCLLLLRCFNDSFGHSCKNLAAFAVGPVVLNAGLFAYDGSVELDADVAVQLCALCKLCVTAGERGEGSGRVVVGSLGGR